MFPQKGCRKNNQIEICVEDEGPGIREENLEKIFRRFYTDRPESFGKNSGLGLNISQQIVKAHGGSIWAENRQCPGTSAPRPRRAKKQKGAAAQPVRSRYAARKRRLPAASWSAIPTARAL